MSCREVAFAQRRQQPQIGTLVQDAPAFLLPDPTRTPLRVLLMGTTVRVLSREDDWYRVMFRDPALGERTGYVLASNIRIDTTAAVPAPAPGPPQQPAPGSPRTPVQTADAPQRRGFFSINGLYQTTRDTFSDVSTFPQYTETAQTTTAYSIGRAPGLDVAVGAKVSPQFAIGAGVTWLSQTRSADVSAKIPHPFFFNTPRDASGVSGGLRSKQAAVHIDVSWEPPPLGLVQIAVFAGPSIFHITQDLVTAVTFDDQYPYDTTTLTGTTTVESSGTKVGYNAGVDVSAMFSSRFGVGVLARYTRASLQLPTTEGHDVTVRPGGVQVGAGLRVRF